MSKSLFDIEMDEHIGIKEKPKIPDILPVYERQIIKEDTQMSGAFFLKDEHLVANIILEFDSEHPKFREYLKRLKDFVDEAEEYHVLKSSSGL
jgi:hypothetical protein